jgi:hypothetical protein
MRTSCVHESHTINEVHNTQNLVGKLIENIKASFPRDEENEKGWGWNLPKMHAFANMLQSMLKFGTARNFSRQIGEQVLKAFVKDHAVKAQRRPDKFVEQCASENVNHGSLTSSSRDGFFPGSVIESQSACTNKFLQYM